MDGYPILVGYDGSEAARFALCWALDEGVRRGLPVCITHVLASDCRISASRASIAGQERREAETAIARMAMEAEDWGQLGIEVTGVVLDGPVAKALCERSRAASMLVVGDRGLGGLAGQRIGSVSREVATHAHCPVVVVRGSVHTPTSRPVGVGVDDAPEARLAVGFALQEAALRGVGVLAVRGWTQPPQLRGFEDDWAAVARDEQEKAEQRLLTESVTGWRDRFPTVPVVTRLMPVTASHALTVASRDAQLMVVGDRGSGGFPGLRLGSVSEQLLHHCLCSVMVVRGAMAPAVLQAESVAEQTRPAVGTSATISAGVSINPAGAPA